MPGAPRRSRDRIRPPPQVFPASGAVPPRPGGRGQGRGENANRIQRAARPIDAVRSDANACKERGKGTMQKFRQTPITQVMHVKQQILARVALRESDQGVGVPWDCACSSHTGATGSDAAWLWEFLLPSVQSIASQLVHAYKSDLTWASNGFRLISRATVWACLCDLGSHTTRRRDPPHAYRAQRQNIINRLFGTVRISMFQRMLAALLVFTVAGAAVAQEAAPAPKRTTAPARVAAPTQPAAKVKTKNEERAQKKAFNSNKLKSPAPLW